MNLVNNFSHFAKGTGNSYMFHFSIFSLFGGFVTRYHGGGGGMYNKIRQKLPILQSPNLISILCELIYM